MDVFIAAILAILAVMYIVYIVHKATRLDAFHNYTYTSEYPTDQLCTMPLTTPIPILSGPGEAGLSTPREPYHLLGDYIPPAGGGIANFKSECAYISDGQRRIEKTGSYGQVTNNYKRKNPDNGTTWLHELSLSFYKNR